MKKLILFLLAVVPCVAQTTITFPNAGVYLSPYTWRTSGGAAIAPIGGAYMKFVLTTGSGCGTSCVLTVNADTTINNGLTTPNDYPSIKWHCDTATVAGTWTFTQFPNNNSASTPVSLSSTLSASTAYTCYLFMEGGNLTDGNSWTGTNAQTQIVSLTLDTGATVAQPTLRPNLCAFWGASYEEGYYGGTATGAIYTYVDPEQTWAGGLAQATVLNCEYGLVGIGTQGWQNLGNGGYPIFGTSWNAYDSTHTKTFSTPPAYVVVHQAENDVSFTAAIETANVTAWIASARTTFGSTSKMFLIGALGSKVTAINTAVQQGVTNAGDAQTFWVNPGTQYALTTFSAGCTASSWASLDCLHLTAVYQNQIYGNTLTAFIMKTLYQQQYQPTHVILGSVGEGPIALVMLLLLAAYAGAIKLRQ